MAEELGSGSGHGRRGGVGRWVAGAKMAGGRVECTTQCSSRIKGRHGGIFNFEQVHDTSDEVHTGCSCLPA